jgi:hypothetical protein
MTHAALSCVSLLLLLVVAASYHVRVVYDVKSMQSKKHGHSSGNSAFIVDILVNQG